MTQTAQSPIQLTLAAIVAKFRESHPSFVEPFERLKPDLEAGTGAQGLANLIGCEVDKRVEQGLSVYSWVGSKGPFELRVPKPFDPHPQRPGETQQQAQVQMEPLAPQAPPEAPQEAPEPREDTPEPSEAAVQSPEDASPAKEVPETIVGTPAGLFTALAELLGDSTLLMTVARTGEQGKEPVLTVTVVPQAEDAFTPVCLEGTVGELDSHFVSALTAKASSKKSLVEQVEALKAADKALEEAKKKEVEAKSKQAEAKKKSAEKKEEEAKAEAKQVEEKAEAEKQQELLF